MSGRVTVFTSVSKPAKVSELVNGEVKKTAAAKMYAAEYAVRAYGGEDGSPAGFAELLNGLNAYQCISVSLPRNGSESGRIVTRDRATGAEGTLTRTKEDFGLQSAQGPVLFDVDAVQGAEVMPKEKIIECLDRYLPGFSESALDYRPSGSSHIYLGDQELKGLRGQHLFGHLKDASDGPRVVKYANARFWLDGMGRIDIDSAGSLRVKGPIDEMPCAPAWLIFGRGECVPPLEQRGCEVVSLRSGGFYDSKRLVAELTSSQRRELNHLIELAKKAALPEALPIRAEHKRRQVKKRLPEMLEQGISAAEAESRISAAVDAAYGGTLLADFLVTIVHPDGQREEVTIGRVLAEPDRYHEKDCLDPLNPGHRGGSPDCRLYSRNTPPLAYSFDDGGRVYRLRAERQRVEVAAGCRASVVQQLAAAVTDQDGVFLSDGGPVIAGDDRMVPLTVERVTNLLGSAVVLVSKGKGGQDVPQDLKRETASLVLAALDTPGSGLQPRRLAEVNDLPFPALDGRIVWRPGWDSETECLLNLPPGYTPKIPDKWTREDLSAAVGRAVGPFRAFKFTDANSAAAMLGAVITAICRPSLPTRPILLFDAGGFGFGKSLAASTLGAIIEGCDPALTPFASTSTDDETRKRLMSVALAGGRFECIDNWSGPVNNSVLAAVGTSGVLSDRKLGASEHIKVRFRALLAITGANLITSAEMTRRASIIRIEGGDDPLGRKFDFHPPVEAVRDRVPIAEAVCLLVRAYHEAGAPVIVPGDLGFPAWSRLVRQLVLWLAGEGLTKQLPWGEIGDPAASMLARPVDPETEALSEMLRALHELSEGKPFTASSAAEWASEGARLRERSVSEEDDPRALLHGAAAAVIRRDRGIDSRALGTAFRYRKERPAGRFKLISAATVGAVAWWRVVPLTTRAQN